MLVEFRGLRPGAEYAIRLGQILQLKRWPVHNAHRINLTGHSLRRLDGLLSWARESNRQFGNDVEADNN
jgi:hypothetical protein